jgi:hypothetical protein
MSRFFLGNCFSTDLWLWCFFWKDLLLISFLLLSQSIIIATDCDYTYKDLALLYFTECESEGSWSCNICAKPLKANVKISGYGNLATHVKLINTD